jgi:hypothetical protein
VNSFQALLAPSLIDNQMLERRVPESDLAGEMLVGSASLAWLGWRCCPPTCEAAGPVASAGGGQGLPGTRIGTREGEVAKATFTVSAPPPRYRPGGPLRRLDGAELDLSGINQAKASPPRCQPVEDRR